MVGAPITLAVTARDGGARATTARTPRGEIRTPAFMPVGTKGTVKTLLPSEVRALGADVILGNTYHLHLRPGEDVITKLGGLNRFMGWPKPILTDSGGFQVFSLEGLRKVEEEGVTFRSHIDGSERFLSPERATEIQWTLGPDVAMAFDHVIPGQSGQKEARDAMERTQRWLVRCRQRHEQLQAAGGSGDQAAGGTEDSTEGASRHQAAGDNNAALANSVAVMTAGFCGALVQEVRQKAADQCGRIQFERQVHSERKY